MKKMVCISGSLLFPLAEGKRAAIRHGGDIIYTSHVVDILEQREDYVRFETMNTVYQVSMAPVPGAAALHALRMCA